MMNTLATIFKVLCVLLLFNAHAFAAEVQKPNTYKNQNISGWMMSEKLDGIRGYWDGKQLLSKNANPIHAPKWFTQNFPPFPLDGELYSKRGEFSFIQSVVLDDVPGKDWSKITYNIFEAPEQEGDFHSRLKVAKEWFRTHPNEHVKFVRQIVCKDQKHLQSFLEKIVTLGGEGVIVKEPGYRYHTGRSSHILKVKEVYDMEGKVVGHNLREDGTLRSLVIELPNGVRFNLGGGFSDAQRVDYPKLGKVVTFKYYGFTKNNKPKFASFLRIREPE